MSTVSLAAINPENGRPGALVVAGANGQGRAFQPFLAKLEPSASLAWHVGGNPKTAARAGYSRSYAVSPLYAVQWGSQAFTGDPTWISAHPQLQPAVLLRDGLPAS